MGSIDIPFPSKTVMVVSLQFRPTSKSEKWNKTKFLEVELLSVGSGCIDTLQKCLSIDGSESELKASTPPLSSYPILLPQMSVLL